MKTFKFLLASAINFAIVLVVAGMFVLAIKQVLPAYIADKIQEDSGIINQIKLAVSCLGGLVLVSYLFKFNIDFSNGMRPIISKGEKAYEKV